MKKITSQSEANKVHYHLVLMTMQKMNVDEIQATKRINALLKSGILNDGTPDDPNIQRKIDEFISTPIK